MQLLIYLSHVILQQMFLSTTLLVFSVLFKFYKHQTTQECY